MSESDEPNDLEEQGPEAPERPLLTLREGLPTITDTEAGLAHASAAIAAGTGPVAIDPKWTRRPAGLEELVLAYLRRPDVVTLPRPASAGA